MLFEYSAEISGGRESCLICYVIDTEFCMENKPDSSLHTYFGYIVVGSHICQCFQLIVSRSSADSYFVANEWNTQLFVIQMFCDYLIQAI